ncbi:VOC family protein [Nocardioides sp.]|uniref:VOC family protein n=1 Tax=Nocardioides sp. TaxID=35761 RepID=UPI002ED68124
MLTDSTVTANIPAADLGRARSFYADKLGLTPVQEFPGGLVYQTGGGTYFLLYETEFAGTAGHTVAQWHVTDVDAEVADLKSRGIEFETYDLPGVTWDGDIASFEGMGRGAWFKDSEGNILGLDDASPA